MEVIRGNVKKTSSGLSQGRPTTHRPCYRAAVQPASPGLSTREGLVVKPIIVLAKLFPRCTSNDQKALMGAGVRGPVWPNRIHAGSSAVTTGVFSSRLPAENQLSQHRLWQCCKAKDAQKLFSLLFRQAKAPIEI
ncbi:hypothetical protein EYF80_033488 [Liparis tanakae]|uniref:Uncharacterized protein n=1 Tax=Liparis tanakae TaxID=230148 RepID=A0A4Z2GU89_9TELE|nr:hypothetical protein EYF80_033488 [Liparis tanakae]